MSYGRAANSAAYVLNYCPLTSEGICSEMTPNVHHGMPNNGLYPPSVRMNLPNFAYEQYLSLWSVNSMASIRLWLRIMQQVRDLAHIRFIFISSWEFVFQMLQTSFPFVKQAELYVPYLKVSGNTSIMRMVPLIEYIQLTDITPYYFFIEIIEICLFGFQINARTLAALRITEQECMKYINERLMGGKYFRALFKTEIVPETESANKRMPDEKLFSKSKRQKY